ncbi:nuclear RNA export factor 1 [Cephus cinctus]|uniref:Nuclear RNA export factor 1 n=1 Tax=Cephus cinctus TaxID=211228 RepID=A0AAJ7BTN4_CEPCN|nr:nuclear RNA export factor 1 [Cephus cinctus]
MPKKAAKGRSRWTGQTSSRHGSPERKQYFDHDDRAVRGPARPKVSFRTGRNAKGGRSKNLQTALKIHLEDDVDMSDPNAKRIRFKGNVGVGGSAREGCRSPAPSRRIDGGGRGLYHKKGLRDDGGWFKVVIPYGNKYGKDFILKNLLSYIAPDPIIPIMYKIEGNTASFFVDDYKTALKLQSCDKKITTEEGFKISVNVLPGYPVSNMNDNFKERLKAAMAKRFVQATNALDLSQFHREPDLCEDYFCSLARTAMLIFVIDIIVEHTPQLEALNLDGNKIQAIDRLGSLLSRKLPSIKILYIGDNRIRDLRDTDSLKPLKLEELRLAGNPLCNKYKQRNEDYISDVRKRFPKLLKLDGILLPAPIVFDVGDDAEGHKLPPSQRAFAVNEDARQVATTFLHQYFTIFDNDDRQPLLDAYDEHASFSLTIHFPPNNSHRFTFYLPENRNLFRVNDREKRQRLLKQGRLPVVSFISKMPKTHHYLNSFTMDLGVLTKTMMVVTVTGLFRELDGDKAQLRYFNRTMIIVPQGSGYCIRNEQVHITDPLDSQKKELAASLPALLSIPEETKNLEQQQEQLIMALRQQSGMNTEWSRKCLEEVQWNFDAALAAFRQVHEVGQVPAEAFQS